VADVQISVGLGRKARLDASVVLVGPEVFDDPVAQEIRRTRFRGGVDTRLWLSMSFHNP